MKIMLLAVLTLQAACCLKHYQKSSSIIKKRAVPVFIHMPGNILIFDNLSPLLYSSLVAHFKRIGYSLPQSAAKGYTVAVTLKSAIPIQKYVSPDILLFHTHVKIEILCQLFNFSNVLIRQKTFYFSTLISKPINPILNSSFLDFEYKKLFDHSVPKIEQFIRPLLIDSV